MEKLKLPKVRSIREGEFVTIPSEAWKSLVEVLNSITTAIEAQQSVVVRLATESRTHQEDISKLAEILKEIYDNV